MTALTDTFEGVRMRVSGPEPKGVHGFLRSLAERVVGRKRGASPGFPDEEEIRLAWFALGRGFDCM